MEGSERTTQRLREERRAQRLREQGRRR